MRKRHQFSIPVQKGMIDSNPPTMKTTPYPGRVKEQEDELRAIRRGQRTKFVTPRKGRR